MNNETCSVTPLFSKPVYSKILDIDTKRIVSRFYNYDFHRASKDNEGSSSNNLYVLGDKNLKFLKDELMKEFDFYASHIMQYSNKFEITTSWITRLTKGQNTVFHNHNNCMISGILYLQVNEISGDICFRNYDNRRYQIRTKEGNVFNSINYRYTPVEGLLLLFPGEVYHKVEENKSDITRYSLAFNLSPVGLIGRESNDSHMTIKIEKS